MTDAPTCTSCPHPYGDHVVAATVLDEYRDQAGELIAEDFPWGGWIFCPVEGCGCKSTWTVKWEGLDTEQIRARIEPWGEHIRDTALGRPKETDGHET